MLRIITNNVPRDLVYRYDVPASVLESDFDYLEEHDCSDGFFKYRNAWYHISDFMRAPVDMFDGEQWDGYLSDSFFSGVLIKLANDNESVICATYLS
jgi:hypothetical protein